MQLISYKKNNQERRCVLIYSDKNIDFDEYIKSKYSQDNFSFGIYDENKISVLTTIYCKGLEFDCVAVNKSRMSINEMYVAYTRALHKLSVFEYNVEEEKKKEIEFKKQKEKERLEKIEKERIEKNNKINAKKKKIKRVVLIILVLLVVFILTYIIIKYLIGKNVDEYVILRNGSLVEKSCSLLLQKSR